MKNLEATRSGILISVAFPTTFRAHEFETATRGLAARGQLVVKDVVTIVASPDGRVRVHETIDPTPQRAAVTGALWGSLIGLFAVGPIGWIAGALIGAGVAALAAQVVDVGITDRWVGWFKQVARPDTTTLALLVDDLNSEAFVAEAARFPGARVVSTSLDQATNARLRAVFGEAAPTAPDAPSAVDTAPHLDTGRS
ncbi:MAG: DUF1269 domain-containing protein [Actinobacteria bacterium]|nr:DUF1269 domain-containing protein [Actinomycetota bacterium]